MKTKNHRVPLALALVALFAATFVPVSGASEQPTTLYTFRTGAPTDPTWTILKLEVTRPEVIPSVHYGASDVRCPMYWSTYFMTGGPNDAHPYNSFGFSWSSGRWGYDVYATTPLFVEHTARMFDDGAEQCAWDNTTVNYGELPVGTVYVLQLNAGLPFESVSTLSVNGPGVSVTGVSSGRTSFYHNETNLGRGWGVVAYSPPFCGAPQELPECSPGHMNAGGHFGAAVEVDRELPIKFKRHPFVLLRNAGSTTISNASITDPTGKSYYLGGGDGQFSDLHVNAGSIFLQNMTMPSGRYMFKINKSVNIGDGAHPGWFIMGADIHFPGES